MFQVALQGFLSFMKQETNARIHLFITVAVIALGYYFQLVSSEWLWIILAISMVWTAEIFNTAMEELCNKVEPQQDPLIKRVKDLSAAAVLVASVTAVIIGLLIFYPKL